MSQMHNIVHAFIEGSLADEDVSQAIPGGFHQGIRLEDDAIRPYAMVNCEEKGREYNSGGSSIASYEVVLTVFGDEKVGVAGGTQEKLAELFDLALTLGSGTDFGQVLIVLPIAGVLEEDEHTIQGKDVVLTKNVWKVTIQEN